MEFIIPIEGNISKKDIFINELKAMGYSIKKVDVCPHTHKHTHTIFVQTPLEKLKGHDDPEFIRKYNANVYLSWEERNCCDGCVEILKTIYDNTDLFFNMRIYKEDEDVTKELWGYVKEIDPEEQIWDDEELW
ncbi:MAG TPA: hypothetical protein PKD85_01090 [Saprospiraceae bacterium]|nr:hypothetical protein [Saprospiraceae bacterium]